MIDDSLLGPAEKHIVGELKQMIKSIRESTQELMNVLEKIDVDDDAIEKMMLDSDGKNVIIATLKPMEILNMNISTAVLVPAMLEICLLKARSS